MTYPGVVKYAKCLLFPDNVKLYMPINNIDDCMRLQQDKWLIKRKID